MRLNEPGFYSDELLAFVITCLFCDAISKEEFRDWCARALSLNGAPGFLYDLMEFDDDIFKIFKVVGHVPVWKHTEEDEYALYGVAVRRGVKPYDMPLSNDKAVAALEKSPSVGLLFCEVFDSIKY